jgi:hypothetical protein
VPLIRTALLVTLLAWPLEWAEAQRAPNPAAVAARHFAKGQALFSQGQYAAAIKEFSEAHRIAPHPSALFNIARCHENRGDVAQALNTYERALNETTEVTTREDITRRIANLRALPVKVFVSSEPSGATVTVDGTARPEAQVTPLVLQLRPGEHVLLVHKAGYQLLAQRVEVQVGKEIPVQARLTPMPAACPPPPPPCPPVKPCPDLRLTDSQNLHIHLSVIGAFAFTTKRLPSGGPGFHAYFSFSRWLVGGHVELFPMGEMAPQSSYSKITPRWITTQLEGGRIWAFRSFYVYASGGVGASADRLTYVEAGTNKERVSEKFAFVWTLGGGIEAMVTRWISIGVGARVGMGIGQRAQREDLDQTDTDPFPVGMLWGDVSFHL